MSDAVMCRLMGWSPVQLAAWRKSQRQPAARYRVDRLRAVLPAATVEGTIARIESTDPVPVGDQLLVTFNQLSLAEQREWHALAADETLSPQRRCEAMRASRLAERGYMARVCDAASAHAHGVDDAQGRMFTDAELEDCIPERLKLPAH